MNEIKQGFFKGISRVTQRSESYDPEHFFTLQNARVLKSGNVGEVKRISGYTGITSGISDLGTLYDIITFDTHFIVFYQSTTSTSYKIKIFDGNGNTVDSFSYISTIDKGQGSLKKYEDTVFIAPHNKIIYKKGSSYYLKDFISSPPNIIDIDNQNASLTKANVEVTINETLSGFGGRKSRGYINVLRNTVPSGVVDNLTVTVGGTTTTSVEIRYTYTTNKIATLLTDKINSEVTGWSAERTNNSIKIINDSVGTTNNGTVISVTSSEGYTRIDEDIEQDTSPINPRGEFVTKDIVNSLSNSITTVDTYAGLDSKTEFGTVYVRLDNGIKSKPFTISSSDTIDNIVTNIYNALNNTEEITELYSVANNLTTNTITLTADKVGSKYNTDFILVSKTSKELPINIPSTFYTVDSTDAETINEKGTLEPDTPYWYTARYRYIDGHTTQTCSPVFQYSDNSNRYIAMNIDVSENDLDNTKPMLQVFRKKEGEEFFLIKEINIDGETSPYSFIDTGYNEIDILDNKITTWTKAHKAQEIVENRNVSANLEFFNEKYSLSQTQTNDTTINGDFDITLVEDNSNEDVIPFKSELTVYTRPQFTDGTLGYFTELGKLSVDQKNRKVQVSQDSVITSGEKDIEEFRFYSKYLPFVEEQNYKFSTPEIQTPNLEGIANPDEFPIQTKVLYGYKYIMTVEIEGEKNAYTTVGEWEQDADNKKDYLRFIGQIGDSNLIEESNGKITATIHGVKHSYIPVVKYTTEDIVVGDDVLVTNAVNIIYKLENFEALKEAVSTNELYTRINRFNEKSLSSVIDDDKILNTEVRINGIEDKSNESDVFEIIDVKERYFSPTLDLWFDVDIKELFPTEDSRIYLLLDDSNLNEIDNNNLNNYKLKYKSSDVSGEDSGLDLDIGYEGKIAFDIINFQEETPAVENDGDGTFNLSDTIPIDTENGTYEQVDFNEARYYLINKNVKIDGAVYLGKKKNEISSTTLDTTGFKYKRRTLLTYSTLAPYNIYNSLLLEKDFNFNRLEAKNQLIWSDSLLANNFYAGGRNIPIENFYNMPSDNGEILEIVSLNGNLYVFCERGVSRLLIGETLTQQKGGNVSVDSSRFITKNIWILENLPPIKKNSIVKSEGYIYFTDGNDVYRIGEGIENISKQALVLDEEVAYNASVVKKYDEFRLTDPTSDETFVYNYKYGQWYGPFTYSPEKTVETNNKIYSWVGDDIVEEDIGNDFGGTPFTTIIQSVGNDTQVGVIDKTYRKFYFSVDGSETIIDPTGEAIPRVANTTFKYGKDFNDMTSKVLDSATNGVPDIAVKNGWYHIGVSPDEGNSKKIYWDIETTNPTFSLKGFVTAYILRRRR